MARSTQAAAQAAAKANQSAEPKQTLAPKATRSSPSVAWDIERSGVILFGGNIKGIVLVKFEFGPDASDSLKTRTCFFVLDMLRKRGMPGLKRFYGEDRIEYHLDETPPDGVEPAKRYSVRPHAWTAANLETMVREFLAEHPDFARPAERDFSRQLAAATAFIAETGIGQMAAFAELDHGRIWCRPAVMVDEFVIALADSSRKSGFKISEADEVNAVAWTAHPEAPAQEEGMARTDEPAKAKPAEARAH